MTQDFSNQFQAIKQSLQTNNLAAAMEKVNALKMAELPGALRVELLYLSAVTLRLANQLLSKRAVSSWPTKIQYGA